MDPLMSTSASGLAHRIEEVLSIVPSAPAIEFEDRWRSWGKLATAVHDVAETLPREGTQVGVLLRNRPMEVGFLLGVLVGGGCVVAINPQRGSERSRHDITELNLPWLAGESDDLAELVDHGDAAVHLAAADLGERLHRTGPPPRTGD